MKTNSGFDGVKGAHSEHRGAFRTVSRKILESANSLVPRPQFLEHAIELLLEFSGCDAIGLVLHYRGRHSRCRQQRSPEASFGFVETPLLRNPDTSLSWTSGRRPKLEKLCCTVADKDSMTSDTFFTPDGSFWCGDLSNCSLLDVGDIVTTEEPGIDPGPGVQSYALICIDAGDDCTGLMSFEAGSSTLFQRHQIDLLEQLVQTFGIALTHRRLQLELRERIKELSCLYSIAKLVARSEISLDEILREAVDLLPPGWLYPEITAAHIAVDKASYNTSRFDKTVSTLKSDIVINGEHRGQVAVGYTAEKPDLDEGPFLYEERHLIDAVAAELSRIVEQKSVQAEKAQLQEQLLHADRLATIGQLAAGVAHELNEPLASILGFAQLVVKSDEVPSQAQKDAGKIVSASLHAREIIKKLLLFARETVPKRRALNLNDVVANGLYFLASRCTKAGIDLRSELSDSVPDFVADQSQLIQVLTNLVVNSIQAMPNGGSLTVRTSCENDCVLLTVSDTGTGITEEVRQKMFNPFFTTKSDDQGTGLGLSVIHGIVETLGGNIKVESVVGRGTTFTIHFPVNGQVDKGAPESD